MTPTALAILGLVLSLVSGGGAVAVLIAVGKWAGRIEASAEKVEGAESELRRIPVLDARIDRLEEQVDRLNNRESKETLR